MSDLSVGHMLEEVARWDGVWRFSNAATVHNLMQYTIALCGEAGEFANVVKKHVRSSDENAAGELVDARSKMLEELVDVQIYFTKLLLVLGCDASEFREAWDAKHQVLRERWGAG